MGFLLLTLPLMPVQGLLVAVWPRMARRLPHLYHQALARLMGIHVKTGGKKPDKGPVLIAANHVSWLDIVVFSAALPVSFIAKSDVRGWPLFGQMAQLQRTVFVDRDKRAKTAAVRDRVSDRLRQGDILVLFPEGTSHDGRQVLPFKSSLFAVAEGNDLAIVPVTIAYTHASGLPMTRRQRPSCAWYGDMDLVPHLWEAVTSGPIRVKLEFHDRLAQTGNRKVLAKEAETAVRASLAEILHGTVKIR